MRRLRQHQCYAMASMQVYDLVNVGRFDIMRCTRHSVNLSKGHFTKFVNMIDTLPVATT